MMGYVAWVSRWRIIERSSLGLSQLRIVGDPSPEAWDRVRRYASWMHRLLVDTSGGSVLGEDTLLKLRLNSPVGGWFPAVQSLSWSLTQFNPPYADLFLSPNLEKISISSSWSWLCFENPHSLLPAIASTISTLPTHSIQSLHVDMPHSDVPWAYFKDSLSSLILCCGPSLTEFTTTIPLSDVAVNHLIHLPHLRTWTIEGPPPDYSTSPLPLVFPSLTELTLGEGAANGWLSILKHLEHGALATESTMPLSKTKESLKSLDVERHPDFVFDASFASVIQMFRNLVRVCVTVPCSDEVDEGQCISKLDDNNVAELVTALPLLEVLLLGYPCFENTCATTVVSLLQISTHCAKLEKLGIHFNTTNITDDLKSVSEDPQFQGLRSLPKCSTLRCLDVYDIPLNLDETGCEAVVNGMLNIFPSLECFEGTGRFGIGSILQSPGVGD